MAEWHQVVDVVVVRAANHDVDDRVKDRRLFHGRFGAGRLDVVFDFLRHLREAIQVEDLLANLVLICLDVTIRVDLLGPKVVHNLDGPFAEDILLKDIRQTRLRIDRKYEYLLALLREPIPRCSRESSLTKPAFTTEHDVFALRDQFRQLSHLLIEVSAIGRATGSGEPRSARKL